MDSRIGQIVQNLSETDISSGGGRSWTVRADTRDRRPKFHGAPVCAALARHQIVHVGVAHEPAPFRDRPYEARGKLFPCDVRGRRTGFRGRTLEAVPQRGSVSVAAGDAAAVSCSTAGSLGFLLGAISGASRTGAPCGCVLADSREVRFRGVASRDSGVSSRVPHGDRAGGRGPMGGTHSALRYELRAAERDGLASLAAVGDRERGLGPSLDLTRDGACCVRERETPRTTFQARAWANPAAAAYLVADAPGGRALGR